MHCAATDYIQYCTDAKFCVSNKKIETRNIIYEKTFDVGNGALVG